MAIKRELRQFQAFGGYEVKKVKALTTLQAAVDAGRLRPGTVQQCDPSGGALIGCSLQGAFYPGPNEKGFLNDVEWFEVNLRIPGTVIVLADSIFDRTEPALAPQFALDVFTSIPLGAKLYWVPHGYLGRLASALLQGVACHNDKIGRLRQLIVDLFYDENRVSAREWSKLDNEASTFRSHPEISAHDRMIAAFVAGAARTIHDYQVSDLISNQTLRYTLDAADQLLARYGLRFMAQAILLELLADPPRPVTVLVEVVEPTTA